LAALQISRESFQSLNGVRSASLDDPQSKVSVTAHGFERLGMAIGGLNMPIVQRWLHFESLEANARAFFNGFLSDRSAE
jgi:hypothetical protein